MSTDFKAAEQKACCAHLRVQWRTEQLPGGMTRGWWQCDMCPMKFMPQAATCVVCNESVGQSRRDCHDCSAALCDHVCEEWHLEDCPQQELADPGAPAQQGVTTSRKDEIAHVMMEKFHEHLQDCVGGCPYCHQIVHEYEAEVRALAAPPVSEGLKGNSEADFLSELDEAPSQLLLDVTSLHPESVQRRLKGICETIDKHRATIESHGVTFLKPPLSEEEEERAKELKASQQWMEQLQHARHAGLAKLKGACACAAGIREEDAVSLVPDHAGAVKYGWNYARGFLEKRQQTVESLLDHLCNSEDKTFCQRGRAELREILGQQFSPREPGTQAGPRCPKCSAPMEPSFVRSSANSKSVVKVRCKGNGTDELSYHELTLATPGDFAQFFPENRTIPAPPCPSTEEGK